MTWNSEVGAMAGEPTLASEANLLNLFADTISSGLAGEERLAKIVYLVVTSRLLDRIVSIVVKGPSSAGKSFVVEKVLSFFPDDAYYALSAMSEHAMAYGTEPLQHRFLVLYEAAGMHSDLATYLVRSLLSEGRVRYETVEKVKGGGLKPRLIEREGPTGLIVTTTEVKLHPENETRLLSLTVSDTPGQTKAVLLAQAGESEPIDTEPWRDLQAWLAQQPNAVNIPYASQLAELIPPVAVRLRRDFPAVLALIRSHAILHQATRARDHRQRVVATIEDYAVVRDLVADLVAEGAERTVSATVRETVGVVAKLLAATDTTTVTSVAEALGLDKSATLRRVRVATERGYVRNLEEKRGRPARLVLGDDLPDNFVVLPEPARLQGCTPAGRRTSHATGSTSVQGEYPHLISTGANAPTTVQPPLDEMSQRYLRSIGEMDA